MMQHMVKFHPEACTAAEREQYQDTRNKQVKCENCGELVSKRNLKAHQARQSCKDKA